MTPSAQTTAPDRKRSIHRAREASERLPSVSARPAMKAPTVAAARGGAAVRSMCPQRG